MTQRASSWLKWFISLLLLWNDAIAKQFIRTILLIHYAETPTARVIDPAKIVYKNIILWYRTLLQSK